MRNPGFALAALPLALGLAACSGPAPSAAPSTPGTSAASSSASGSTGGDTLADPMTDPSYSPPDGFLIQSALIHQKATGPQTFHIPVVRAGHSYEVTIACDRETPYTVANQNKTFYVSAPKCPPQALGWATSPARTGKPGEETTAFTVDIDPTTTYWLIVLDVTEKK